MRSIRVSVPPPRTSSLFCLTSLLSVSFCCFCQGISLGGLKVLLSVYTKERGRPGREGLVFEIYNQETSATVTLHVSSQHLLHQASTNVDAALEGIEQGTSSNLSVRSYGQFLWLFWKHCKKQLHCPKGIASEITLEQETQGTPYEPGLVRAKFSNCWS